jgi:hypothetical protein
MFDTGYFRSSNQYPISVNRLSSQRSFTSESGDHEKQQNAYLANGST